MFYDGVNDVLHGCRSELDTVPSHMQEKQIASRMNQDFFDSILISSASSGYLLALQSNWCKVGL